VALLDVAPLSFERLAIGFASKVTEAIGAKAYPQGFEAMRV